MSHSSLKDNRRLSERFLTWRWKAMWLHKTVAVFAIINNHRDRNSQKKHYLCKYIIFNCTRPSTWVEQFSRAKHSCANTWFWKWMRPNRKIQCRIIVHIGSNHYKMNRRDWEGDKYKLQKHQHHGDGRAYVRHVPNSGCFYFPCSFSISKCGSHKRICDNLLTAAGPVSLSAIRQQGSLSNVIYYLIIWCTEERLTPFFARQWFSPPFPGIL